MSRSYRVLGVGLWASRVSSFGFIVSDYVVRVMRHFGYGVLDELKRIV